ncbi:MAG: glycosyltransferase family 4 protein [Flavobacteriales bacterium]|nr:glycosyltransferase family 4 protein [Flavobacteriales bacterium]
MKILFLTTQLPYPPVSGGVIKTWNLVRHWSSSGLKVICALKPGEEDQVDEFLSKVPQIDHFMVPFERKRTAFNLLKSYLFAPTLNVYRNFNIQIKRKTEEWAQDCDVIFVDHYEMGQYVPSTYKGKVILHEHNAEYVMWERLAEIEKNPFKKILIKLESNRIRKTEKAYSKRATLVLAAPNDIEELATIGVSKTKMTPTYHLGEDFLLDSPDVEFRETEKSLLFVGTLTWEANIDGLLWFLDNVYPQILGAHPNLKFYIIGKNPDPRLVSKVEKYPSVELTGFVKELEPYFKKARVFVIPLRFGSGIKVKLLNAMYRGIPVVTTPIGTEGLAVESGKDLFCTSKIGEQVSAISTLLDNEEVWNNLRNSSRAIAKNYTWKKLLSDHDATIQSLLQTTENQN